MKSGGPWVGYKYYGFSFLDNGRVTNYASETGSIYGFAQDRDGTVWAGASIRSLRKASGRTSLVHTGAQCGKISVQARERVDTISGRSRSRSHRHWLPEALTSRRSRAGLKNKELLPRSKHS